MQIFRKILCPVDFSEYSKLALHYAAALTWENDAQLIVFHSVPDLALTWSYLQGNYQETIYDAILSRSTADLKTFLTDELTQEIRYEQKITCGNPAESILKTSQEEDVDLIVMGTHGHSGYERFLVGSVTNKVLHKASVPVLVVCKPSQHFIQPDENRPVQINRILCAIDFEPNNQHIAQTALSLARTYQSEIFFLHVFHHEMPDPGGVQLATDRIKGLVSAEKEDWCEVHTVLKNGNIKENILDTLNELKINLLVMGHHTRKPMEEYFLGSVAKSVVPESPCPVLVVRSSNDRFQE
jgi:nucleotide-binding universal stress UspA family protein